MVARNFSMQELPYSRLLQIPDDEREFLTLEELKPLTDLGVDPTNDICQDRQTGDNNDQRLVQQVNDMDSIAYQHAIYYDLNAQSQDTGSCSSHLYMDGNQMTTNLIDPHHHHQQQHHHHQQPHELQQHLTILQQPQQVGCSSTQAQTNLQYDTHQLQPHQLSYQQHVPQIQPQQHLLQTQDLHQLTQQYQDQSQQQQHHNQHHSDHLLQEPSTSKESIRKRRFSYANTEQSDDLNNDPGDDAKSVKTTDENKRQNHSEIEKRRRDKMNTYISELSSMIPMCHAMSRKLDKLTVLRMAVQHLKTIRGAVHSYTEGQYKPSFISEQELKSIILQAAEGFLFVVGCDRGRILYVSESVSQVLNYCQGDLLGQSWFDILHPKDVSKVKEQLSSSDLSPREKLIDAKTMLPVKADMPHGGSRMCPGARRSFFCRMKCKAGSQVKDETEMSSSSSTTTHRRKSKMGSDKKYIVIQCTGYLKSWAPAKIGLDEQQQESSECDPESYNLSCLVAVGRILQNPLIHHSMNSNSCIRSIQFLSRHAMDGKFLFIDQRATPILGFLPQELLGTSMYEYYHHDDIPVLAESHKAALQGSQQVFTPTYRIRCKDGSFIRVQSEWKSFKNPWTKEIEYLTAKNNILLTEASTSAESFQQEASNSVSNYEFFNQSAGRDMQRMINTHIEASKIGRQIADQVLDYERRLSDSSAESSPGPDTSLLLPLGDPTLGSVNIGADHQLAPMMTTPQRINGTLPAYNTMRNTSIVSSEHGSDLDMADQSVDPSQVGGLVLPVISTTPTPAGTSEGNDEAAMAVIMSLLEADAGLGGPVDFSGLPWPLP